MIKKLYWTVARITFLLFLLAGLLSGGILIFLLGPLYSWYFLNDLHCFKYARLVFPCVIAGYKVLGDWLFHPTYSTAFFPSLVAAPAMNPDLSKIRVSKSWNGSLTSCDGCIKCCELRGCPLFDHKQGICLGYGSFFWRYFNCGRYPVSAEQINYYNCPKWAIE